MNRDFVLTLGPAAVGAESPVDLVAAASRWAASGAAPLFRVGVGTGNEPCRVVHRDRDGAGVVRIGRAGRRLILHCPTSRLGAGGPLLTVAAALLEHRLNRAGHASLVAACVALPPGGVLLLGAPGSGKTSTAIALCRNLGGRLVANDQCVLGVPDRIVRVLAGSKTVGLRAEAVRRHLPELAGRLDPAAPRTAGWWPKTVVPAAALDLAVSAEPVPLAGAYLVEVDDRAPLSAARMPAAHAWNSLYEAVSRVVRGTSVALLGGDDGEILGYLPSLDSRAGHAGRVRLVEALARDLGIVRVSGPVHRVARWIADDAHRRCRR